MKRFYSPRTVISLAILSIVSLFLSPVSQTQAAPPTLVVNANRVLHAVTHVASGGLYGLGSGSTPNDSMVIPLHLRRSPQFGAGF
jgi:hypothetical protein